MTQNVIYAAVAGIDESYLSNSENMTKIKVDFRRARIRRRSLIISLCACFIVFSGAFGMTKMLRPEPPVSTSAAQTKQANNTQIPNENTLAIVPFSASIDPDADAYGEEEIHEVRLTVSGVIYEQLPEDAYESCGISQSIPESALGESVGTVVESFPNREPDAQVSSPEPSLVGAEVYYYLPTGGKAVVIAEKDGRCSPFAVSHWLAYRTFGEICEFYGAEPTDAGIESISYTIAVPENGAYRVSGEKTITDAETIDGICAILSQLTPEDPPVNEKAPTPEWLIDAMQEYRENPERFTAEDIVMTVRFRNGTMMRDILYKPYIGNGYLDNMKELTPRQNAELRALFG